jgi:hypothetical protein
LAEEVADDLGGISAAAQPIELGHDFHQRLLDVLNGPLRIVLTLLIEAALTLDELFAVEVREGMKDRIAWRTRIGQEA